jgi:hypothetical protein
MGEDEEVVLISALEHWSYCPRQCVLGGVQQAQEETA